jgi:hypothetical protein
MSTIDVEPILAQRFTLDQRTAVGGSYVDHQRKVQGFVASHP